MGTNRARALLVDKGVSAIGILLGSPKAHPYVAWMLGALLLVKSANRVDVLL
jgi:hypothetical protein